MADAHSLNRQGGRQTGRQIQPLVDSSPHRHPPPAAHPQAPTATHQLTSASSAMACSWVAGFLRPRPSSGLYVLQNGQSRNGGGSSECGLICL